MIRPWRGFIDGEPVSLELSDVRERYGTATRHMWYVNLETVRLARDKLAASMTAKKGRFPAKEPWPDVVELFVAARREDAPLVAMARDAGTGSF